MKIPREFLRGIVVGLVGAGLLAVGYFVFAYVWLFIEYGGYWTHEPDEPDATVEATVQNVFQQDIVNDWGAIEQIIGPESDYELQEFSLEYMPTGEIRNLYWMVEERQEDGSCDIHAIFRNGSEYEIYMDTFDDGVCNTGPLIPLDQFWNMMTSDFIRGTARQEPYEYASLGVHAYYGPTTIGPSSDQNFFVWDGSQVKGPFNSGRGYLVDQYLFKSEDQAFTDWKTFLIGGTYQ